MHSSPARIAPYEQWCDGIKQTYTELGFDPNKVVGTEVSIVLTTMKLAEFYGHTPTCDGREWLLTPDSANKLRGLFSLPPKANEMVWICEHCLQLGD